MIQEVKHCPICEKPLSYKTSFYPRTHSHSMVLYCNTCDLVIIPELSFSPKEQQTLLKIKSLLNHLRYIVKEEHLNILDKFHQLCRKYCSQK